MDAIVTAWADAKRFDFLTYFREPEPGKGEIEVNSRLKCGFWL